MLSPSLSRLCFSCLAVVLFCFALGAAVAQLPANTSARILLWRALDYAGWWWWSIAIALAAIGLYQMSRLTAAKTTWGKIARLFLLFGFAGYIFCWGNNALGAIAAMFILAGVVMVLKQMADNCAIKPPDMISVLLEKHDEDR